MTFFTYSLGCKVNSYECEAIKNNLINKGYVFYPLRPDIIIINTCSVTHTADQKSRQHIRKFKSLFPLAIIVVMGCYSQGNVDFISKEIRPSIIIGTSFRNEIPNLIEKFLKNKSPIIKIDNKPFSFTYEELGIITFCENARAYLKISDGCSNFCSYCLIPFTRGKIRERNYINIYKEACSLVRANYHEIILTGIHVGGYGKDKNNPSFSSLTKMLLDIPNLYRLRISSIEASEIDDNLIALLKKNNFAKHFHIPLQSGSDGILKAMNRKYNKDEFLKKITLIRSSFPNICLTTDVIVGFPDESEEDFLESFEFIKKCNFSMLHVFPYSPREGTLAATFKNQVNPNIKKERVKKLLNLSTSLWDKYKKAFIGEKEDIIIEKIINKKAFGHTSNYLEICIDDNNFQIGDIVNVLINENNLL